MSDDAILKKVLKGLGEIGEETGKEAVKQVGEITESVITGQELFGVKALSDEELAKKKAEDEQKKQEELAKLRQQQNEPGRNLEAEIEQIREEKKREEEEREKQLLEQARQEREAQEMASQQAVEMPGNAKREAAKTQFTPGKKKKTQQPDPSQMSQTNEFKGSGKME
jgi:hypothetical protein